MLRRQNADIRDLSYLSPMGQIVKTGDTINGVLQEVFTCMEKLANTLYKFQILTKSWTRYIFEVF